LDDSLAARCFTDQLRRLHLLLERIDSLLENLPDRSSARLAPAETVLATLALLSQQITLPLSTLEQASLTATEFERCLLDLERIMS
jgi:hypothetical protein